MAILATVLLASSCKKEVVGVRGEVVTEKYVSAEAGSFPMIVTMDGIWRAETVEDWLYISADCEGYIKGDYSVTVCYESNQSTESRRNFNRLGHVIIRSYDGFLADTVLVKQRGLEPYIELRDTATEQTECAIALNTNLTDEQRPGIACTADATWVKSLAMNDAKTAIDVTLEPNTTGAERETTVRFAFTDAWGETTEVTCTLTQK